MELSEVLRHDHDVLRATLAMLEEQLPAFRTAFRSVSVSRLLDSLATHLRLHTEREERLLAALAPRGEGPFAAPIHHLQDEHENQRTRLAILHELLTHPEPAVEGQIVAHASHLVQDLREHMAAEERQFFPLIHGEGVGGGTTAGVGDEAVELLGRA